MLDKDAWIALIQQEITKNNPAIDVEFGPVYDTIIAPMATVLERIDNRLDYIKSIVDINKWSEWTDEDLESIAANYGLTRRVGTKATGVITFFATSRPSGDVNISKDVTIMTVTNIKFLTTDSLTVLHDNIDSYKNTTTGRYEFNVPIQAVTAGSSGDVPAGSIISMSSYSGSINGVVNKIATQGGYDEESNEELVNRIKTLIQGGYNPATVNNMCLYFINNFPNIRDIAIEKDNPIISGTIDVFYIGTNILSAQDSTYWYGANILLQSTPVIIVQEVSSGATVFTPEIDYILVLDAVSMNAGTNKAFDKIVWMEGGLKPSLGAIVTISYYYNDLANLIDTWQKQDYNVPIDVRFIYRQAISQSVELQANVKLYKGYGTDTMNALQTFLYNEINSYLLGESLEISDIDDIIRNNISGIDNFLVTKLCIKGGSGANDLKIGKSGYFIIDVNDIVLTKI